MKIKNINIGHSITLILIAASVVMVSCESFINPEQGLIVDQNDYFKDWNEYRASGLGLYAIQQELVTQLVVLGELRADLVNVTENADRDLLEIATFQVSQGNKYASPLNFYRLIGACNRLSSKLEAEHPEVITDSIDPTIYDRLYGEVVCMRAWAYFNAVRIFKEVPYIYPSLTTVEEINEYVSTGITVINPMKIEYGPDGYDNDTIYGDTVVLEKIYLDLPAIVDTCTVHLTEKVKIVGVVHNLVNGDPTWEVTIWNRFARYCLLGQMQMEVGNIAAAKSLFEQIVSYDKYNELIGSGVRYGLDSKFSGARWQNIFTGIDIDEHILTLWFNKSYQQQNQLQTLFSTQTPNQYMLKPTRAAVQKWESQWRPFKRIENSLDPNLTVLDPLFPGNPGDYSRGHGVSFVYERDGIELTNSEVLEILMLKKDRNEAAVKERMAGVDTVVKKYSLSKNSFDHDANFSIYRAGGIHLYYAEIHARLRLQDGGILRTYETRALRVLNDGTYNNNSSQKGVRGRVSFGLNYEAVSLEDPIYVHDPIDNAVIGYRKDLEDNFPAKQLFLEDQIMDERARELAFEGERFYDLMRVARRRDDPSYLANRVAAKFNPPMREQIRQHLLDEENWYLKIE